MTTPAPQQTYTVRALAEKLGGEAVGDLDAVVRDVKPIDEAGPGDVTFVANMKYAPAIARTQAACVIVAPDLGVPIPAGLNIIRHESPYVAFAKLIPLFRPTGPKPEPGIHPGAHVSPGAKIGRDAGIGAGAVVEAGAVVGDGAIVGALCYVGHDVTIGAGTRLHPRVVLYHGVKIGASCILHSGCVIGGDGFGYASDAYGMHHKIPQVGIVVIEDEVEVGANTTIDRAVLGETRIGFGVKIDNLVMIAHNCEIGPGSIIVAQSGISGSTKLGHHVIIAAQAGLVGHIEIGDMARVGAQSGVTKSVPPGAQVVGSPHMVGKEGLKAFSMNHRLPEFRTSIMDLEKRVGRLEAGGGNART